jgi:GntR family transcriptional regulator of vanillate catabolism
MAPSKRRLDNQTHRLVFSLRERILRGEFAPGQRLTELGLAPLLGASRTPVRLVLERLAHEGLLEAIPTGGFRVRSFTVPEILDAIEIRAVLEGTAVRFAAERLGSRDELSGLKSLLAVAKLEVPVTVEGFGLFLQANDRFHHEMWRLSKSAPLIRALEAACRIPFAAPSALVFVSRERDPGDVFVAAEHHRAIVEAIEARQGTRAEALAREHALVGCRTLLLSLERGEATGHLAGAGLIVP